MTQQTYLLSIEASKVLPVHDADMFEIPKRLKYIEI